MGEVRRVIGIDLGTTNSCVATVIGGKPQVIPNAQGYKVTPSEVAFLQDGRVLVGQPAKRQRLIQPQATVYSSKRLIGRLWDSVEAKRARTLYSYPLARGDQNEVVVAVGDERKSLAEIGAIILTEVVRVAEEFVGDRVRDVVITVPAYFDDHQRTATKRAGELAGLNVLRIINEPTAAALAYGLARKKNATIAVYDLGGGTFDVSILEVHKGVFRVLATAGDTFLGGEDFDQRIVEFALERFAAQEGFDLREEPAAFQRLKEAAEKVKCDLSMVKEARIALPFLMQGKKGAVGLDLALDRKRLDALCGDLVERTLEVCRNVLSEAGLSKEDIDDVVLVGGQTRMPLIQDSVSNLFGRSASKQIHPDEAVAVGAALHGDSLVEGRSETLLLDVTPMALGIKTAGGTFTQIIPRFTTVPVSRSHTFTTVTDNQKGVKIQVYQGHKPMATDNAFLGEFFLAGIKHGGAGEPEIDVEFNIDASGIVHVSATDLETQAARMMTLATQDAQQQLEEAISDEIAVFNLRLAKQTESDLKREALRLALYRLRKDFEVSGSRVEKEERRVIVRLLDGGDKIIRGEDVEAMKRLEREIKRYSGLLGARKV